MLCLSRRKNESVILITPAGQTIRVVVTDTSLGKVRLAFEADDDVRILRAELQHKETAA
jgi:carbon storage regulator CsrA